MSGRHDPKCTCTVCGSKQNLTRHHPFPKRAYRKRNDWQELYAKIIIWVCRKCHDKLEKHIAQFEKWYAQKNKPLVMAYRDALYDFFRENNRDSRYIQIVFPRLLPRRSRGKRCVSKRYNSLLEFLRKFMREPYQDTHIPSKHRKSLRVPVRL